MVIVENNILAFANIANALFGEHVTKFFNHVVQHMRTKIAGREFHIFCFHDRFLGKMLNTNIVLMDVILISQLHISTTRNSYKFKKHN